MQGLLDRSGMPVNPLPADFGSVAVWDEGAEAPRPRRDDEITIGGSDPSSYNLFVIAPAIGVRNAAAASHLALLALLRARRT